MSKKKKDDIYESKWEVFLRNYNQVPGFKALVRLGIYFVLFLIFILIINFGGKNLDSEKNVTTTTTNATQESEKLTYKEMLNNLSSKDISIEFTSIINNYETRITALRENGVITGLIENRDMTKKFKIQDDQIYEIVLDRENLNTEIFSGINYEFFNPTKLVSILNSNQSTKRKKDSEVIYNYNISYNGISYDTTVVVVDSSIKSIELIQESNQYRIIYS